MMYAQLSNKDYILGWIINDLNIQSIWMKMMIPWQIRVVGEFLC